MGPGRESLLFPDSARARYAGVGAHTRRRCSSELRNLGTRYLANVVLELRKPGCTCDYPYTAPRRAGTIVGDTAGDDDQSSSADTPRALRWPSPEVALSATTLRIPAIEAQAWSLALSKVGGALHNTNLTSTHRRITHHTQTRIVQVQVRDPYASIVTTCTHMR